MFFISPLPISHYEKERENRRERRGFAQEIFIRSTVRGKAVNCQSYGGQSRKVLLFVRWCTRGGNVICIDFIKLRVEIG